MKLHIHFFLLLLIFASCSDSNTASDDELFSMDTESTMGKTMAQSNPFFSDSTLPLGYPRFDQIKNEHYEPAFKQGIENHLAEVEMIASQSNAPTFENTIVALEISGQLYNSVASVFFALSSAHTNDEILNLQQRLAPELASYEDSIMLNRRLFERISDLYERRSTLGINDESIRLLSKTYKDFIRAGAALDLDQQERLKALNAEIAVLETEFRQNILSEVNDLAIVVDSREELAGLSESRIDVAFEEAAESGREGQFVIPLLNTSGQPTLAYLQNRDLRERIHKASLSRGHRGGEFDNRGVLSAVLEKRATRANLLGYANHAEYILENQTALTVEAVNERLSQLASSALANVLEELASLQDIITYDGQDFELASWDWDFYSERLRTQRFDFDADDLSPYFELDNVLQRGVFYAAENLFGITFQERFDLPVYQDDVRVFEVFDVNGETLALFIADFYARPSKRGGAWMNAYISQSHLLETKPVIANHLNITKPTTGQPTLLTFDEVTTMFHEFGHALHGMFSSVEFPSFSGTRVPRDFVEFPSQVNEMWAVWPEVLKNYAVHHQTGEAMPIDLLNKVLSTQSFNQGFSTLEYLSASIIDQALHQLDPDKVPSAGEIMDFELRTLKEFGILIPSVPPRYRSTYFSHIMGGYSAGYYSYIWSEVLDADAVNWFTENGGLSRFNGDRFRASLLSKGGSKDAMTLYRDFAGREASITALLERRGLN